MKSLPVLILIMILAIILDGCHRTPDNRLLLSEEMIETRPDSALAILSSLDPYTLRDEADRALYAMLMTMAQDKCNLDPTDDSLISVAVDYYRKHDDPKRAAISSYYQGRVYYLGNSFPEALVSYLRAKDIAERNNLYFWAGMACRGLSKMYHDIDNYGAQLTYARKQKDYTLRSGQQPFLDYAWVDYACALHNAAQVDSALVILDQLLNSHGDENRDYLYYKILRHKSQGLIVKGQIPEAQQLLSEIVEAGQGLPMDSMNLAWSRFITDNQRVALDMLDTITGDGRPMKNVLYAQYYSGMKDYKNAVREYAALDSIQYETFYTSVNHNLSTALEAYHDIARQLEIAETHAAKTRRVIFMTGTFIIIVSLCFVLIRLIRRHRKILAYRNMMTDGLQKQLEESKRDYNLISILSNSQQQVIDAQNIALSEKDKEIAEGNRNSDELKAELARIRAANVGLSNALEEYVSLTQGGKGTSITLLKDLLQTRQEVLERLAEVINNTAKGGLRMKDENKRISVFVDDYIIEEKQLADMERLVDAIHGNIMQVFRTEFWDIKPIYNQVFLYHVVGLSNFAIMALLHEKDSMAVYNKKKYLKARIIRSMSPNKDKFLRFL